MRWAHNLVLAGMIMAATHGSSVAAAQIVAGCTTWQCCERIQYGVEPNRIAWTHVLRKSTTGNFAGDAPWTDPLTESSYDEAWQAWTRILPGAPAIEIESGDGTTPDGFWGTGDEEVVQRWSNWGGLGTHLGWIIWPDYIVQHMDIQVRGDTASLASGVVPTYTSSCALNVATEAATVVHELGHGYGFDHFDRWPSMMATSQNDILGCVIDSPGAQDGTASQMLSTDALSHMCMYRSYGSGSGFGGYDVSITPVVQQGACNAATTPRCYSVTPVMVALADTDDHAIVTVEFTTMNNRGALPDWVVAMYYLSADNAPDAGDLLLDSDVLEGGWLAGETRLRRSSVTVTGDFLDLGTSYTILVRLLPVGVTETREDNNTTDLAITVVRTG